MTHNRAIEYLQAAQCAWPLLRNKWGWKARTFVDLAVSEVEELLDYIAILEARPGIIVDAHAITEQE